MRGGKARKATGAGLGSAGSRYRRTTEHGDDFIGHGQKRHDAEHSGPCRLFLVFESQLHLRILFYDATLREPLYDPVFK